jgi:hypothetical protein
MSISRTRGCSMASAESHEHLLESGDVDRRAPAHAFERVEDLRSLHHSPRERSSQRQGRVLERFHKLPAAAEQQDASRDPGSTENALGSSNPGQASTAVNQGFDAG